VGKGTGGKRIGLVVNPEAGGRRGGPLGLQVAGHLRSAGHDVVDLSDVTAAAARERARNAVAAGLDALAVAGGDGMVHLGANVCAGTGTPLAIIATGTGNDVARCLGIPVRDPAAAAEVVSAGTPRRIDAIRRVDGDGAEQWFAGVLGAGFDSFVNQRANRWAWPRGRARYPLAVLRELPLFRPIPYAVTVDGVRRETRAMLVTVANTTSYGGGMQVCPDARVDDGLLDVMVVHEIGTGEFLRVFPKVFGGGHLGHPAVEVLRGREVVLEAEGVMAFADGEPFAPLPLSCHVVPGALQVLVPPGSAGDR
jgi:diacylglycerol kinase (ATP)